MEEHDAKADQAAMEYARSWARQGPRMLGADPPTAAATAPAAVPASQGSLARTLLLVGGLGLAAWLAWRWWRSRTEEE